MDIIAVLSRGNCYYTDGARKKVGRLASPRHPSIFQATRGRPERHEALKAEPQAAQAVLEPVSRPSGDVLALREDPPFSGRLRFRREYDDMATAVNAYPGIEPGRGLVRAPVSERNFPIYISAGRNTDS